MNDRIAPILTACNSRLRTRTIDMQDVAQAVSEARRDGYGWVTGGMITANSYKYKAESVATAAILIGRTIYVSIARIDAKGSPVTWWGPSSKRPESVALYLRRMSMWPLAESDANIIRNRWIRLSTRDIAELRTIAQPKDMPAMMSNVPDVTVTRDHSIACGNCTHETDRICALLGATQMPAVKLMTRLAKDAPELLRYARRAVDYAAKSSLGLTA